MTFQCLPFYDLSHEQLYRILQLRQEVFVIEQNCVYEDLDDKDQDSYHFMGYLDGKLLAYTRLLPKGLSYSQYASIGRVITAKSIRNKGYGKILMKASIDALYELWGKQAIKISAQTYLLSFYTSLGFVATGEEYLEDGIPHRGMVLNHK